MYALWHPGHCLLQIDSVLHVLFNENSYPDWKDLKIDYETDQSAQVPSFDDQAESIGEPERLSVPSESPKLEILMQWCLPNRWPRSLEQ